MLGTKIALNPTKEQEKMLFKYASTARFVYNWALNLKVEAYKDTEINLSAQDISKIMTQLKQTEFTWLYDFNNETIKQAIKDMESAFTNMFKKHCKFPKFKKKGKTTPSFYTRYDRIKCVDKNHVKISGFKEPIKTYESVSFNKIKNSRISFDGKYWYLSYSTEIIPENIDDTTLKRTYNNYSQIRSKEYTERLGIDLGISYLAVGSNGCYYENINNTSEVIRLKKKIKRLQQQISRKYILNKDGNTYIKTNNIKKLERQLKLIHRRLANIRNTYLHIVTTQIVKTKPSKVVIEDLKVSKMLKNKYLAKEIHEQGFHKFRSFMEYKCNLYGIPLVVADAYYPSSKQCSCCKHINKKLKLSDREYKCIECGITLNRDYNAAINLKNYKLA